MRELRRAAAPNTDGMHLLHILGNSHKSRHWSERFPEKIRVETGDNHPHARVRKFLSYLHERRVKKLRLVNAHDLCSFCKFQHFLRRIHRKGTHMLAIVRDHVLLGIAYIYAGLEHGYFLVGELRTSYASDEFFCLAREHRAADNLYRTRGFRFFKKHFGDYLSILPNFAICSANIINYTLMENNGTQFLTDILTRIHSIKEELELLEEAVLEQLDKTSEAVPQENASETEAVAEQGNPEEEMPIEEDIPEVAPAEEEFQEKTTEDAAPGKITEDEVQEETVEEDTVFDFAEEDEDMPDFNEETAPEIPAQPEETATKVGPEPEEEPLPEVESEPEEVPLLEVEPVVEPLPIIELEMKEEPSPEVEPLPAEPVKKVPQPEEPAPVHIPEPVIDDELEVLPIGEALAPAKDAVMDKMAAKESWRSDIPGAKVSDVRSAISLNDRVLFINTLFHEDPIAFQNALSRLNSMPSFDEGVNFILGEHPEWNTESEIVYRFMMAVRRKLR